MAKKNKIDLSGVNTDVFKKKPSIDLSGVNTDVFKKRTPPATGDVAIPESSRISYVHNNPGNLMYIGQEGAKRGEPKEGGGYWAKFESPQEGYQSLIKDIQSKQQGKTSTGLKPESTLADFFNVYAPPSENDTQGYISTVAESLGVSPDTPISELDSAELAKVVARQESGSMIGTPEPNPPQNKVEKVLSEPKQDEIRYTPDEISKFEAYDNNPRSLMGGSKDERDEYVEYKKWVADAKYTVTPEDRERAKYTLDYIDVLDSETQAQIEDIEKELDKRQIPFEDRYKPKFPGVGVLEMGEDPLSKERYVLGQKKRLIDETKRYYRSVANGSKSAAIDRFWEGLKTLDVANLVTLGLEDMTEDINTSQIYRKAEAEGVESLSQPEKDIIVLDNIKRQAQETAMKDRSFAVGSGIAETAPFIADMIATSGVGAGIRKGAFKAATRFSGSLKTKALRKLVSNLSDATVRSLLFPSTYGGAAERMQPEATFDEEGEPIIHEGTGEPIGEAMLKSAGSNVVEIFSEGAVGRGLQNVTTRLTRKGVPILRNTKVGEIFRAVDDAAKNSPVMKMAAIQDPLTEFGEEIFAGIMQPIVTGDGSPLDFFERENMIRTALTVSIISTGMATPSAAGGMRKLYKKNQGEKIYRDLDENSRELFDMAAEAESVDDIQANIIDIQDNMLNAESTSSEIKDANRKTMRLIDYLSSVKKATYEAGRIDGPSYQFRDRVYTDKGKFFELIEKSLDKNDPVPFVKINNDEQAQRDLDNIFGTVEKEGVKDAEKTKEKIDEPVPQEGAEGRRVEEGRVRDTEQDRKTEKEIKDGRTDDAGRQERTGDTIAEAETMQEQVSQQGVQKSEAKTAEGSKETGETGRKGAEAQAAEGQAEIIPATELSKARDTYQKTIKDKGQNQQSALDSAWKRITRTQWYKGLNEEQQQQAETEFRNVRAEQIVNPARATKRKTREKLPSQKPAEKAEVNTMQAIRDEIKMWTSQAREQKKFTEKEFADTVETVKTKIKEAVDNNFITRGQYKSIINRIGKATTEKRRENLFDYVDEVLEGSAYKGQVAQANKVLNKVKKANKKDKSKFGTAKPLADEFQKIDPKEMSIEELRLFNQVAPKVIKGTTPNIENLRAVLSRFKDRQKTENKVERIKTEKELNEFIEGIGKEVSDVSNVREFMNVTRKMTMARNKAAKLRDEGVISEEAFNDIDAKIGKNMDKNSEYEQQLETFKAEYAGEVADKARSVKPEIKEVIKDMNKDVQTSVLQFLNIKPKDLNDFRIIDIEAYDTTLDNMRAGEFTPQAMRLMSELEILRNRKSYVDDAIDLVSKSKLWQKFAERGFVGPKLRMWQQARSKLTGWKAVTGDNLLRFLMSTKGHRIDMRLGILDKVKTLNNGLVEISRALQKESNAKDKYQDKRIELINNFKKVHGKDHKERMDKLGFLFLERTWQNSKNYSELSKENASLVENMFSEQVKKKTKDRARFEDRKRQWREMYAEAKENNLLNENGTIDVSKYEQFIRKDKATADLIDGIDNYLNELKEISRWATMQNGRTFIELDGFFPLRSAEFNRETDVENLQQQLKGEFYKPKMQANSTYMREGAIRWTENDIFKVLEDHTNEIVRNFYVTPTASNVIAAIKRSGEAKANENIEEFGDSKDIALLTELYNKNIEDRLKLHYRVGDYSIRNRREARIGRLVLGGGKKVMLAVPARVPAEMAANVTRGTLAIGEVPTEALRMSRQDKGVYSSLLEEYMGDKYYSKYAPEVGAELSKNKYIKKAERGADWFIILSDKVAGKTIFVHEFNKQFEELTGEKFNPKKYSEDLDYYVENRDAIDKSATWGLRRYEELFNDKTAMTAPQLTTFLGGMIKAKKQSMWTQVFDILQSFARNEVDQVIDSARRIRHGDEQMKAMGYRDLMAVTISNFQYQTLRRAAGVAAAAIGTTLLGQEPTEYEEEAFKSIGGSKDEVIQGLEKDLRQSAIGLTMGGSSNVYAYLAKLGMYVLDRGEMLSDEKKEKVYDILENDLYARRIAMGGTTESVVKTIIPLPSGITSDIFELMDGTTSLYLALVAAADRGDITDEELWEVVNAVNVVAKYAVPNPITPSLVKPIRRWKMEAAGEEMTDDSGRPVSILNSGERTGGQSSRPTKIRDENEDRNEGNNRPVRIK